MKRTTWNEVAPGDVLLVKHNRDDDCCVSIVAKIDSNPKDWVSLFDFSHIRNHIRIEIYFVKMCKECAESYGKRQYMFFRDKNSFVDNRFDEKYFTLIKKSSSV